MHGAYSPITTLNKVCVQVHWLVKIIYAFGLAYLPFMAYKYWQQDLMTISIAHIVLVPPLIWAFFLACSKLSVDQHEIHLTAPHGSYTIKWAEVKQIEKKGQAVYLWGESKAMGYNLLLAGKGRREFQNFMTEMISKHKIPSGRPTGVTYFQAQRMMLNSKVRSAK